MQGAHRARMTSQICMHELVEPLRTIVLPQLHASTLAALRGTCSTFWTMMLKPHGWQQLPNSFPRAARIGFIVNQMPPACKPSCDPRQLPRLRSRQGVPIVDG